MRRIAVAVVLPLLVFGYIGSAQAIEDSALAEKLVSGSPWNASALIGRNRGQASFVVIFTKQGNKLGGELQNYSGFIPPGANPNGSLKSVDVKNGEVAVVSPTGGEWKLKLDDAGRLVGPAFNRTGTVSGDLTLTPKQQSLLVIPESRVGRRTDRSDAAPGPFDPHRTRSTGRPDFPYDSSWRFARIGARVSRARGVRIRQAIR